MIASRTEEDAIADAEADEATTSADAHKGFVSESTEAAVELVKSVAAAVRGESDKLAGALHEFTVNEANARFEAAKRDLDDRKKADLATFAVRRPPTGRRSAAWPRSSGRTSGPRSRAIARTTRRCGTRR